MEGITVEFAHPVQIQFMLEVINKASIQGKSAEVAVMTKAALQKALAAIEEVPVELVPDEPDEDPEGG